MDKMITLRFQSRCKSCNQTIPAGEKALWLGKGKGIRHIACSIEKRDEIPTPKAEEAGANSFTLDYSEVRQIWEDIQAKPREILKVSENVGTFESFVSQWSQDWSGSTVTEMRDFIRNGYRVPGLEGVSALIPARPRRKLRYSEDGDELLLDLAWAGVDEPFTEWEKRSTKPGLSVEIYMTFSAIFPAKTIAQYQRWIARALQTLDENGTDLEVSLVSPLKGLISGENLDTVTKIRVKKAGEASDFSSWSAMFSPGGFRQLMITSTGIHADRIGKRVGYGFGYPQAYGSWEVAYDPERNIIVIGNSNSDKDFPEFAMTEKLAQVLRTMNG